MSLSPLDIFEVIMAAILAILLVATLIAVVIGYVIYRAFSVLSPPIQSAVVLMMFIVGLALIISQVGLPVGLVILLAGVFAKLFSSLGKGSLLERV